MNDNEIIDDISKKFNMTQKEAKKQYMEKKEILKMNLIDNSRYKKSKIHPGIFIKLNIDNQFQVKFIIINYIK